MTHLLRFAARSDRGLLRANNQDSVYAGERLLVVADGMGGHAAGDLASRVVVAAFAEIDADPPGEDLTRPLARAIEEGNEAIAAMVEDDPDLDGMGTTATALLFDGDRMALGHIGDSRAYLYRGGVLQQLSHDDTFVQSLVDDGRITEEEAAQHPQRNLLLRALNGTEPEPMLALREISLGDRYMICSDGLSSVVGAEAIAETLADPDPDRAADRLIELALVAGGPDNVTVIVADVVEIGARSMLPPPSGPVDLDATGPIKPIHTTQRMPRVALPAIPDDIPAAAQYLDRDGGDHDGEDDRDEYDDDDRADDDYADDDAPTGRIMVTSDPAARRRRRRRTAALAAAVIAALAVAVTGTGLWTRSQYYVGDAGGQVVVYRGVTGSVLGISLASVLEDSCAGGAPDCIPIRLDDLQQDARDSVLGGIDVQSVDRAHVVMRELRDRMLPYCDSAAPTTSSSGSTAAPGTGSSSTGSPSTSSPSAASPSAASSSAASSSKSAVRSSARSAARPTTPPRRSGDRLRNDAQRFAVPDPASATPSAPTSGPRPSRTPTSRTPSSTPPSRTPTYVTPDSVTPDSGTPAAAAGSTRPTTDAAGLPICRPRR